MRLPLDRCQDLDTVDQDQDMTVDQDQGIASNQDQDLGGQGIIGQDQGKAGQDQEDPSIEDQDQHQG